MFIFRADGSRTIGMGHIMRCFSIAECLRDKGKDVCFLISGDSDLLCIQALGIPVLQLMQEDSHGWSSEEAAQILSTYNADAIILDSYRIVPEDFSRLRAVAPLFYIDDLWAFDYDADAIINYNIEAEENFYFPTIHPARKLYLGPSYFPMRKELLPSRTDPPRTQVRNVLITTGSTDPLHISRDILQWLEPAQYPGIIFHVLLGAFYETNYSSDLTELFSATDNVVFLSWGQNMKELYESTDILISPGSTMIYEALACGVSCISYCFADNQLTQCLAMDEKGVTPYIGDFRQDGASLLAEKTKKLFQDSLSLLQCGKNHKATQLRPDGKGAERIAEILLSFSYEKG